MALNAKKFKQKTTSSVTRQEPLEPGTYPCRVVQILDLGLQPQRPYKGEEKKPKHEIMMTYEFVDEFCVDDKGDEMEDKPRWLSERYTMNSLDSELAKSTKRYNAIDPNMEAEGDFGALASFPCNVTVVNREYKDKVYDNVGGVTSVRARDVKKMPELVNAPKVFDLSEPDMEVFGSLPEWIQDLIKSNLEFKGSVLDQTLNGGASAEAAQDEQPPFDSSEESEDDDWV